MHRVIRDHLEEVLATSPGSCLTAQHLNECEECRVEVAAMREHARLLQSLQAPEAEMDLRPGFYARVMERIESQAPRSIWSVFSDSPFGRRIAVASMALALSIGVYLYTAEPNESSISTPVEFISGTLPGEDQPGLVLTPRGTPDRDAVLVNLVTYREQ